MVYEFACHDCRIINEVVRPVELSGLPAACPVCGEPMERIFHAPNVIGRGKPGSFKHDKGKLNAWDDRIAHLKDVEHKWGSSGLKKVRGEIGEKLYRATLGYKKERYAS